MKRNHNHSNAAALFVMGAVLLGGVIFAAIKFGGSISTEQLDSAGVVASDAKTETSAQSNEPGAVELEERGSAATGLPTDQDKIAMLAGNAFSDQVSSGNGYCSGEQVTFDNIGTDGVQSLTISNRPGQPDVSANWDVSDGKLILTNLVPLDRDGNEMADEAIARSVIPMKVWANGQGEANGTEMMETGQIQIGNGPIFTFCRTG